MNKASLLSSALNALAACLDSSNQRARCADCKHALPSCTYPLVNCTLRERLVEPNDQCIRFEPRVIGG